MRDTSERQLSLFGVDSINLPRGRTIRNSSLVNAYGFSMYSMTPSETTRSNEEDGQSTGSFRSAVYQRTWGGRSGGRSHKSKAVREVKRCVSSNARVKSPVPAPQSATSPR